MHQRKIAAINAIAFFFFWLLILLAGADKPPPLGFIWLIIVIVLCALVVFWRIPNYIDWYRTRRRGRLWRVVIEGIVAGLVVAAPFVLIGQGEPSNSVQPVDYAIWIAVLGLVGAINSGALYSINGLVARRMDARVKGRVCISE